MSKQATAGRLYISGCQMVALHNPDSTSGHHVATQYSILYHIKVNKTVTQQYKVITDKSFNNNSLIYNFGSKLSFCGFGSNSLSVTSLFYVDMNLRQNTLV